MESTGTNNQPIDDDEQICLANHPLSTINSITLGITLPTTRILLLLP
jgi:hypothetical protein